MVARQRRLRHAQSCAGSTKRPANARSAQPFVASALCPSDGAGPRRNAGRCVSWPGTRTGWFDHGIEGPLGTVVVEVVWAVLKISAQRLSLSAPTTNPRIIVGGPRRRSVTRRGISGSWESRDPYLQSSSPCADDALLCSETLRLRRARSLCALRRRPCAWSDRAEISRGWVGERVSSAV
jgi:hypothetical protein